jgi:hypothetical protein
MRDFTINQYNIFIETLLKKGFEFQTFSDFLESSKNKVAILRHDVDKLPANSLLLAKIQKKLGIKGTYYFRIVTGSWDVEIIRSLAEMGHEIGYHYETLDTCHGNIEKAYEEFCRNLETFRRVCPIKTICMHGSPLSKYDNRDIWKRYDYKNLGLIGEPYFDMNFNKVFYLTDTGRRWDGDKFSIRDKVPLTNVNSGFSEINDSNQNNSIKVPRTMFKLSFSHTKDIVKAVEDENFPNQAMITIHPQRWTDNNIAWAKELIFQKGKNIMKRRLILIR